ncbi:hypothetical protein Strain138_000901 [Pseudogemmatithrix spongiicola]|uniref:Uncharacterized protein n=1 Tax=Pseudogemmatithrix spongiicola TaxID=3062599 RepID=A0AA49JZ65_9BACT|nr:hypothetical protein Strain138_000901 [Gemmatimonadaceae bacterium 'strain 138']WKW14554.1 hypothetical protein Strain318_000901 [Gemmatimonadaceae bacterium 'strain 318']
MAFLRWLYDMLAVLGTVVLIFIALAVGGNYATGVYRSWTQPDPGRRPSAAATPNAGTDHVRPTTLPTAPRTRPLGRDAARERGIAMPESRRLFVDVAGSPVLRTRNAWVEHHGRRDYLLVTRDAFFVARLRPPQQRVLQLGNGRVVPFEYHDLADGQRVAFARFCEMPPDSLVSLVVRTDSTPPLWSDPCV